MTMLKRFKQDERGSVLVIVALSIVVLIGVVGIGIDLGTTTMIKTRAQNASDAGAIAAALADGASAVEREQIARRYVGLNYPDNYLGSDFTANRASIQTSGTNVVVDTVNITRKADLVQVIGTDTLSARAVSEVNNTGSVSANLRDIFLVMDGSNSMNANVDGSSNPPSRLIGAKAAANILVDEIVCNAPIVGSRIGWVEYTSDCPTTTSCVPDIRDEAFSSSCSQIRNTVSSYTGRGWTNGADGMERAEILINASPRPDAVRAVVYMTDGVNNVYRNTLYSNNAFEANQPALAACNRLKARGILVYGIAFSPDAASAQVIQDCATSSDPKDGYYFYAPDEVALENAFRQITTSIKKIRITK